MLSEYHSEALAAWSLRNRVWDYLIKPIKPRELLNRLEVLSKLPVSITGRRSHIPPSSIPVELRWSPAIRKKTALALSYIEHYYHERISLSSVSQLCGMTPCTFSRTFSQEHDTSFREYLLRYRTGGWLHKVYQEKQERRWRSVET